jgi:hypothetical protein
VFAKVNEMLVVWMRRIFFDREERGNIWPGGEMKKIMTMMAVLARTVDDQEDYCRVVLLGRPPRPERRELERCQREVTAQAKKARTDRQDVLI